MNKTTIIEVVNKEGKLVGFYRQNDKTRKLELYSSKLVTFEELNSLFEVIPKTESVPGEEQLDDIEIMDQN